MSHTHTQIFLLLSFCFIVCFRLSGCVTQVRSSALPLSLPNSCNTGTCIPQCLDSHNPRYKILVEIKL